MRYAILNINYTVSCDKNHDKKTSPEALGNAGCIGRNYTKRDFVIFRREILLLGHNKTTSRLLRINYCILRSKDMSNNFLCKFSANFLYNIFLCNFETHFALECTLVYFLLNEYRQFIIINGLIVKLSHFFLFMRK